MDASSIEPLLTQLCAVKAAINCAERAECAKVIQQFVERVDIKFVGEPASGRTRDVEVTFIPKKSSDLPKPMKVLFNRLYKRQGGWPNWRAALGIYVRGWWRWVTKRGVGVKKCSKPAGLEAVQAWLAGEFATPPPYYAQ